RGVGVRAVRAPDRLLPASRRGAPVLVRRMRSRYEDDVLAGLLAPGGVRDPVAPLTDLKTPRVRLGQPEPRRSLTGGASRDGWRDEQRIALLEQDVPVARNVLHAALGHHLNPGRVLRCVNDRPARRSIWHGRPSIEDGFAVVGPTDGSRPDVFGGLCR